VRQLIKRLLPTNKITTTEDGLEINCSGVRLLLAASTCLTLVIVTLLCVSKLGNQSFYLVGLLWLITLIVVGILDAGVPPLHVSLSRSTRNIKRTQIFFLFFNRQSDRNVADLSEAFVDSSEVLSEYGRPTGHITFHPLLKLRDGTIERLAPGWSFSKDDASRIAAEIAIMISGSGYASCRPVKLAGSKQQTIIEKIEEVERDRGDVRYFKGLAFMVIAGGSFLTWQMRHEFTSQFEATVLGATSECQYSWRISKDNYETKKSDCSFVPKPQTADFDKKPKVYRGKAIDVGFNAENGRVVRERIFLQTAEAERAIAAGKTIVVFDPGRPYPVRSPLPIWMPFAIPVSGFFMYMAAVYRQRKYRTRK
jgi:hypothetical protein